MSNVEISHTDSYGLRIREETSNILFENSVITDIGAGGMWIGDRTRAVPVFANQTKILSNEISYVVSIMLLLLTMLFIILGTMV